MNELPELEAGWAWADIAKNGSFAAKDKGILMFEIEGPVWVQIPVTAKAAGEQMNGYTTKYIGEDGEPVTLTGANAIALRTYLHSFESYRGFLRQSGWEEYQIRDGVADWRYGAAKKAQPLSVDEEDLAEALAGGKEALETYLKSRGVIVEHGL